MDCGRHSRALRLCLCTAAGTGYGPGIPPNLAVLSAAVPLLSPLLRGWLLPQAAEEYRAALEASTPLPQFQATLNYRVTYNEGGLWSLYTQSREVTLPGRTLMQRWGDTWDLRTGYPVSMGEFFPRAAAGNGS